MNNKNKQYTFGDDVGRVDNQGHIGSSGNHNTIDNGVGEVVSAIYGLGGIVH